MRLRPARKACELISLGAALLLAACGDVKSPTEPLHLQSVKVTDDPATIGPVDLVMFGVKLLAS